MTKLLVLLFSAVSAAPIASNTIVDLAVATPDLATLVAALKAGALVDTLSGPGPFTVFAPTNEAFAELPKATLAALLEPKNKKFLDDILTYHVVAGDIHSKDLKTSQDVKTVEGKSVEVVKSAEGVWLWSGVNGAKVTTADVDASNGVVHIINKVLIPPGFVPPTSSLVASNTIVDLFVANPGFSTLVAALKAGALVDTLSGPGPFTVFAPTNEAFAELPKATLAALLEPKNKKFLDDVLTYHVVAGIIHSKDFCPDGSQNERHCNVKTIEGKSVTVAILHEDVEGWFVNGAKFNEVGGVPSDVDASNGVVHIINKVLIPPGFVPPTASSLVESA